MFAKTALSFVVFTMLSTAASAAIKTETVEYTAPDGAVMEGYVAYDDAVTTPRPGIVIVHDWMGLTQFDRDKAEQLAKEGYLTVHDGAVELTRSGLLQVDRLLPTFFEPEHRGTRYT